MRDFYLHLSVLYEDLYSLKFENCKDFDRIFYSHIREHLDRILFFWLSLQRLFIVFNMAECCDKRPVKIESGPFAGRTFFVPCGKCANCLEHKQNEFLVKSYRAALYFGSFWMLSLTYRPEKVHVSGCLAFFEDGKVESHSRPFLCDELRDIFFDRAPLGEYTDSRGRVHTYYRPFWLPVEKQNGIESKMFLMQTFDKRDVQSWIKCCRITYERNFGKMPQFKYVVVPEYGGLTMRPHFHVCIYGLDAKTIYWMRALWNKRFGFCDVRKVQHINDDGSDGFAKMSAYVSKYLSKGLFEDKRIANGFGFKPRITSSRFLGLESPEDVTALRQWHLAFDRAGKTYRVEHPFVAPKHFIDKVTGEGVSFLQPARDSVELLQRIVDRMYINMNGYKYPMPKTFKNVIYATYSITKKRYTASELSCAIADFLQAQSLASLQSQLDAIIPLSNGEKDPLEVCRVTNDFYSGRANDSTRAKKRILRYYQRQKVF